MVQLTVRLTAVAGRAPELVQALRTLKHRAELDSGCSGAHLAADVEEASAFWYCEDWQDVDALERQMRSERFAQLLAIIETGADTPLLEFRVVDATRGLEYIAAVRETTTVEPQPTGVLAIRPGDER